MRVIKSKLVLGLLVLTIGWLGLSFIKIRTHENIVNKEVAELEDKISEIEKGNSLLGQFIEYMSHPSFLEKEVRLKLNYKALDEEVAFVYTDDTPKISTASFNFSKQLAQMPNFIKWWYYLIGY